MSSYQWRLLRLKARSHLKTSLHHFYWDGISNALACGQQTYFIISQGDFMLCLRCQSLRPRNKNKCSSCVMNIAIFNVEEITLWNRSVTGELTPDAPGNHRVRECVKWAACYRLKVSLVSIDDKSHAKEPCAHYQAISPPDCTHWVNGWWLTVGSMWVAFSLFLLFSRKGTSCMLNLHCSRNLYTSKTLFLALVMGLEFHCSAYDNCNQGQ